MKIDLGVLETVADSLVAGEAPVVRPGDHNVTAQVVWCRGTGASGTPGTQK